MVFDFTAPALLSSGASPALAKLGDDLIYSVTAERAAHAPRRPWRSPAPARPPSRSSPAPATPSSHRATDADADGSYDGDGDDDRPGGQHRHRARRRPVRARRAPPTITSLRTRAPRYSAVAPFNQLVVELDVTESLDGAGASLEVLARRPAMLCSRLLGDLAQLHLHPYRHRRATPRARCRSRRAPRTPPATSLPERQRRARLHPSGPRRRHRERAAGRQREQRAPRCQRGHGRYAGAPFLRPHGAAAFGPVVTHLTPGCSSSPPRRSPARSTSTSTASTRRCRRRPRAPSFSVEAEDRVGNRHWRSRAQSW